MWKGNVCEPGWSSGPAWQGHGSWCGPAGIRWYEEVESAASPCADWWEDDKGYKVIADLPGFNREDVKISVEDGCLSFWAEHKEGGEGWGGGSGAYRVKERCWQSYRRSFALPHDADWGKISARLKDGVLTIDLPKAGEWSAAKRIELKPE